MGDCIRVTVRHEGLGALSKGLTASLAGIVPFCALDLVSRHIHCPLPPLPNRPPKVRAATHGRRLHRPPTDHRLLPHRRSTRRSKSVSAPPRAARPARSPFSAAAPARAPLRRCSGLRRFERCGSVSLRPPPPTHAPSRRQVATYPLALIRTRMQAALLRLPGVLTSRLLPRSHPPRRCAAPRRRRACRATARATPRCTTAPPPSSRRTG